MTKAAELAKIISASGVVSGVGFTAGNAVLAEAELELLDGLTAGTAIASKVITTDANIDSTGMRNLTISGELDAATLDISGNVDIDGTLETDAFSIASTAVTSTAAELNILDGVTSTATELNLLDGVTSTTAELNILDGVTSTAAELNILDGVTSTTAELNILDGVTSTAAELNILDGVTSTAAELNYSDTGQAVGVVVASKVVTADANKDVATLRNVTATTFIGNIDAVDGDFNGTLEADAITLNGTAITATATLSTGISNNNVPKFTSGVADNDFLKVAGTVIEGRSAAEVLSDIGASAVAGSGSIVTTGALDSGTITSGFGTINNGASTITTTGTVATGAITAGGNVTRGGTVITDGSITDTGDFTLDIDGDIILDADGQQIYLKNGGTHWGTLLTNGTPQHFYIDSIISDGDLIFRGNDGGSTITALTLDMSAAGAATFNNDVTAFSDKRLKTDISNIENGLDKVMQMQGVYYKRNDVKDAREQIGVLAQDMEAIMPEVVLTADDEMQTKSVDYGKLCAVLIESIKELKAEIDELKRA